MKRTIFFCVFIFSLFWGWQVARGVSTSSLVINEIGATEPSGFEWVEIFNRGENPLDLTGFKFYEEGINHALTVKQGNFLLNSHEFAVIVQDDVKFKQKYPGVTSTILDSSWGSLNESGEEIGLKDASGNFLEKFSYIAMSQFALERKDPLVDDYTSANWVEHPSSNSVGSVNVAFSSSTSSPTSSTPENIPTPTSTPEAENPPPISEEENTVTSTPPVPIKIVINEFVPQPNDGEKEWIEILNDSEGEANIHQWTVEDGSGKIATVSSSPVVAHGFVVVELTSSKFNNGGDTVRIKNVTGEVVDEVVYGDSEEGAQISAPKKGNSVARVGSEWRETTTPTKGSANTITPPALSVQTQTSSGGSTNTSQNQTPVSTPSIPVGAVVINEIYPNPPGSDTETEFIELYNTTNATVDLTGYKISDASTSFSLTQKIEPFSFLTLYRKLTHISLNNSGEEVVKIFNGTNIVDEVEFESEGEGQSLNRDENGDKKWSSKITPNAKNIFVIESDDEEEKITTSTTTKNSSKTNSSPKTKTESSAPAITSEMMEIIEASLHITEIFPSPEKGAEEFIELCNSSSSTIDISSFQLDDEEGGSRPFVFPAGTILLPHGFLVSNKKENHLSLNNTEDSARILSPSGEELEEVAYDETEKGLSYAKNEKGKWEWTVALTPGSENVFDYEEEGEVASKKSKKEMVATTLEGLSEFEKGQPVSVKGVVVIPPGVMSTQYFYISDTVGVQVYMSKKDFPALAVGDLVQVLGELSETQGQPRIKVKEKKDIIKLGKREIESLELSIAEVGEDESGKIITVQGEVTEKKSTYLYVDDGSGEIQVTIKKPLAAAVKNVKLGQRVEVTGMVLPVQAEFHLIPRFASDIVISASTSTPETAAAANTEEKSSNTLVLATTGGFASLILGFLAKIHGSTALQYAKKFGGAAIALVKKKKDDDIG